MTKFSSNSSKYFLKLEIDKKSTIPAPKSSLRTNKTHKLIKYPGFAAINHKILKKYIFKNKQSKPYQSSKTLTPNEWAWRKKKKEPNIAKNS